MKELPELPAGPTKTCHTRAGGDLPDPDCTPGVTNPNITQANIKDNICKKGWSGVNPYTGKKETGTDSLRPPSSYTDKLARIQMKEYGYRRPRNAYEEDHLISLQLGGNPVDPRNLWPEFPHSVNQKDNFEGYLKRQVCNGEITLAEAQRQVATDWKAAWIAAGRPNRLNAKKPSKFKPKTIKHH
jgi:hypothetical protein